MFTSEIDPARGFVKLISAGHVTPEEIEKGAEDLEELLARFRPGFRLLADLSGVVSMPLSTAPQIARMMDLLDRHGVALVVRVLPPDQRSDIGFGILSQFHYSRGVRIVTCKSAEEALDLLAE